MSYLSLILRLKLVIENNKNLNDMKYNKIILLAIGIFLSLISCDKDEIMSYEGVAGINFLGDSTYYSFMANEDPFVRLLVPVSINGDTTNYDRPF